MGQTIKENFHHKYKNYKKLAIFYYFNQTKHVIKL